MICRPAMSPLLPVLLAALWTASVPPAESAAQQQITAGLSIAPDELRQLIDRAVAAATRPLASKLDSRIDTLDARLETYNADLDTHQCLLAEHTSQIGTHQSLLAELTSQIGTLQSLLAELTSQIGTHQSLLAEHTSQIGTHQSLLAEHTSQIAGQKSELDTVISRTEKIQQTQVDGNTTVLSSVKISPDARYGPLRDCGDLPDGSAGGVYLLRIGRNSTDPVPAYCDVDSEGGKWTVFQRRADIRPRQNFDQDWAAYKNGFGELDAEFWWGLENISAMTSANDRTYELRIDLEDFLGNKRYATYKEFRISSEADDYRLSLSNYKGNARDSLGKHNRMRFTTKDKDNDKSVSGNCATKSSGGWWYGDDGMHCLFTNLNGVYLGGPRRASISAVT